MIAAPHAGVSANADQKIAEQLAAIADLEAAIEVIEAELATLAGRDRARTQRRQEAEKQVEDASAALQQKQILEALAAGTDAHESAKTALAEAKKAQASAARARDKVVRSCLKEEDTDKSKSAELEQHLAEKRGAIGGRRGALSRLKQVKDQVQATYGDEVLLHLTAQAQHLKAQRAEHLAQASADEQELESLHCAAREQLANWPALLHRYELEQVEYRDQVTDRLRAVLEYRRFLRENHDDLWRFMQSGQVSMFWFFPTMRELAAPVEAAETIRTIEDHITRHIARARQA